MEEMALIPVTCAAAAEADNGRAKQLIGRAVEGEIC
jgi:hypothetical protein